MVKLVNKAKYIVLLALLIPAVLGFLTDEFVAAEQITPQITLKKALDALEEGNKHEALEAAHRSMLLLTQQDQFHIRMARLVSAEPEGWGVYIKRKSNRYKLGEKVRVYVEPGSFKYERGSEGLFNFGFTVDFVLAKTDGEILGGQQDFGRFPFKSHRPNTEIFLDLKFTLSGLPADKYVVKITVHDMISKEIKAIDIPIEFIDGELEN
ncbi:MAG: hypothetical protein GY761_08605 [Hyphomicrobiales bacterium]|nr:hypothetical protein [Hyphomicrobiales bacterium]